MTPDEIKTWAGAGAACVAALKEAIALLPDGDKKRRAEEKLRKAEMESKKSDAFTSERLGFQVCLRCLPPEIMVMNDEDIFICRNCKKPFCIAPKRFQGPRGR